MIIHSNELLLLDKGRGICWGSLRNFFIILSIVA